MSPKAPNFAVLASLLALFSSFLYRTAAATRTGWPSRTVSFCGWHQTAMTERSTTEIKGVCSHEPAAGALVHEPDRPRSDRPRVWRQQAAVDPRPASPLRTGRAPGPPARRRLRRRRLCATSTSPVAASPRRSCTRSLSRAARGRCVSFDDTTSWVGGRGGPEC